MSEHQAPTQEMNGALTGESLGASYSAADLQTEKVVSLSRTDLVILSWGYEAVSFVPGGEDAAEFAAAERKIDQALDRNADGTVEEVSLTLQDLIILSWGHESVSFIPGSESAAEFAVAEAKIDKALHELRDQLLGSRGQTGSTLTYAN